MALAGGLLVGGGTAVLAPMAIHWYAQPSFPMGCDCGPAMSWAMDKMVWVRVPGHADHRFRRKPITRSGKPITDSGVIDQVGMG